MDEKTVSLTLQEWDSVTEALFVAKKEATLDKQEELEKIRGKMKKQLPGYC